MLRVTGTVNQGVTGTITNTARVNYTDALGNPFAQVTATDVDNIVASSNLSITKTDAPDPVNPGQAVVYTVTVNNAGPSDATNLVVSDNVPSQYTVTGVTSPAGTCGNVGNSVTCTRPAFARGAAAWVITINVTVNAATPGGTYVNTATVSATETDPTPANNTANDSNTVRSSADLAVTKTDGIATVSVGGSTTYTITLTNNGPVVVPAGIIVSDTIPANTVGSEAEADCAITAGVFRCTTTAPLAVGAVNTYQLTLTLLPAYATATLVNTASITTLPALFTDPVAANNTATDTDAVPQANLSITKTDSTDPVNTGASFNYVLTVNNAGPSTATNLTVSDTVPSQYTVNTVTSPTGSCGNVGNVVTCTLASMASGCSGVGDHDQRHRQAHDPGRHVREHRDGERVVAERSGPGQQHREQQQHGASHGGSRTHQDRRRGDGERGRLHDLHDHRDEQRSEHRAGGHRHLGHAPRGDDRIGGRSRLHPHRRALPVHDGDSARGRRVEVAIS